MAEEASDKTEKPEPEALHKFIEKYQTLLAIIGVFLTIVSFGRTF
jgi:hypothetical protein